MLRFPSKSIFASIAVISVFAFATLFAVQNTKESKDKKNKSNTITSDKLHTKNPVPATSQSIMAGEEIYKNNCRKCHGPRAIRDDSCVCRPNFCPPDLRNPQLWKDGEGLDCEGFVYWTVTEGRSPMPRFGKKLSDKQRWDVVNYLHSLTAEPRAPESEAEE